METARALSENLATLLRREHGALAEFLVALAVFDRERRWAELGHASLFAYLHRELRLSKAAAQYRKVAAELIQEVPAVADRLRSGELCLSSIIEAARMVTAENWADVLPRFYGRSRREAVEVVAALQPHPAPPARTVVTAVRTTAVRAQAPVPHPELLAAPMPVSADRERASSPAVSSPGEPAPQRPLAPAPARAELVPLSAERRRLHVTVSTAFARKLEQARDARPDLPSEEALLEAGLDLLIRESAKRKGLVERPQKKVRPSNPDRVPAHVKREVWERDGGKCQHRLASGELCGSTHDLQFDHVVPKALGGDSTAANLRLTCRLHNLEAARRVFGDAWMDRYCGRGRERAEERAHRPELPGAS